MEYVVYKRFKDEGIDGRFNLPFGTVCEERGGYLFAPDGRRICAAKSENGVGAFPTKHGGGPEAARYARAALQILCARRRETAGGGRD